MPGMGNIEKMFGEMGIPGLSKKSKVNVNAMRSHLERTVKNEKFKQKMLLKSEENKKKLQEQAIKMKEREQQQQQYEAQYSEEAMEELYKMIGNSETDNKNSDNDNKKKKKKKKNKK